MDRIASISLHSTQVTPKTIWNFLRLRLQDGTQGWGEASVAVPHERLDAYAAEAHRALAGQALDAIGAYIARCGKREIGQAAILGALDQAWWDAGARRAGQAAAGWKAPRVKDEVAVYANMNRRTVDRSPEGFFRSAQSTLASGYTSLKIAPFDEVTPANCDTPEGRRGIDSGLARVAALREAGGANVQLFVDCHWRFDKTVAEVVVRELAALGVVWFECPIAETEETLDDVKQLRKQANGLGMRLAGLEKLTHPDAFLPWLESGAYDVVMPDVKYTGGISGVLKVAQHAEEHGIACAPHNPTGPICHAASLAACAMSSSIEVLEHQVDETPIFWEMVAGDMPRPLNGISRVPAMPGLGVVIKEEYLPGAS